MKTTVIAESAYKKLLVEILQNLQKTQQKITRQKVEMSWRIGKLVEEHLYKNKNKSHGQQLILRLEQDTKISKTSLYKMCSFYQTYKKLPSDDPKLNWSHYRVLAGIEDKSERKYLEDLTKENDWSGDVLQQKVGELKNKKLQQKNKSKNSEAPQKLKVTRGKLFTYRLAKMKGSDQMFVDLGFGIFSKIETKLSAGEIFESVKLSRYASERKSGEKYLLKKSTATKKEMHTYKAFLDRVVDGDTIHVSLDLGFGIFHKEILRLAKINAPEAKTTEGKKSFVALKRILKAEEFLIVKTNKTDIYGRYIADVFLGNEKEGSYLNQELLDLGVVESVNY